MKIKVKLIVAVDSNNGIGKNNNLPWHLPADMKFFKETTVGSVVVMGRKNYESIPERFRPLPNRENVVLTKQKDFNAPNCIVFNSLEECLEQYENNGYLEVWIIGGGQIYKEALDKNLVDEMYVTHIIGEFGCDTFFPEIDLDFWSNMEMIQQNTSDEKNPHSFSIIKYAR